MSATLRHDTSYEWKATLVLSLAFGLVGLDRFILPSLFGPMSVELGLNEQHLGQLVGILAVAWGASAVLFGGLSDRLGRRNVLVPAVVFFSLMSGLSGAVTGLVSMLLIRALMGVAEGAVAPTGVAAVVEASHPNRRGINNGFFQCAIALFGLGVAPIMATQLLEVTSWRNIFLIAGIPGLIMAAFLWKVIREPSQLAGAALPAEGAARPSIWSIFRHRNIPLSMLALLCAMMGIFILSAFMPSYLLNFLKLESTSMGFVTSAIGFGGAIGQFAIPAVSDFTGRRVATVLSFIVAAVFLYFFIHTGAGNNTALFVLLFGAALFNFGALAILAGPIPAEAAPPGLIATAAGFVIGVGEIFGGGFAPVIAGSVARTQGIDKPLTLTLGALVAGVFISLFLQETAPRRRK
ncbi:MAG: MFS transporter [Steroidobacteraceae bacterium]